MVHKAALLFIALLLAVGTSVSAASLRVAIISDFNGSYGSVTYTPSVVAAVNQLIALKPDLVISTGDMVAGQRRPHLTEAELRAMWAAFHATVSDPLMQAGIPLAVTPGNHDASAYGGFELERRVYAEEWRARMPRLAFVSGGDYPFSYAFDLGPARFISLDVTRVGPLEPQQMNWLADAVADANPARIVFSHLPLWPFAIGRETEVIGDPFLETRMIDLGIDLHLSGHHHAFYAGAVNDLAVVSQACLASGPRRLIGGQGRSVRAITIVDIAEDGDITISALTGEGFSDPLDISRLQKKIQTPQRVIERLDLSGLPRVHWTGRTAASGH